MYQLIKHFAFCLLLCVITSVNAIEAKLDTLSLDSKLLKRTVPLSLYLPFNYDAERKTPYPLLITAAGDSQINVLLSQIDWLSHVDFGPMPQVLVLRMPAVVEQDKFDTAKGERNALLGEVLAQEALPMLSQQYNLAPFHILEGFSTAGNVALDLFSRYPKLYQAAVITSPALELADDAWRTAVIERLQKNLAKRSLFVSLGSFSGNKPHFLSLQQALVGHDASQFSDLSKDNYIGGHSLGFLLGISRLFADREIVDFAVFAKEGVEGVLQFHQKLAAKYGYSLDPTDNLKGLASYYYQHQQLAAGDAVYQHLLTQQPSDVLLHVRKGQALHASAYVEQAKQTFRKALQLAEQQQNQEAQQFITRLLAQ
ncbi:alpha/beta hydrolase-fold protein [Pseudoalteromonas fenneropenaei]|uniref:Alpha/beta hydrolase-fold protein n=1 Tax=Pseudoalteromonas fenneropenaei TaxID=1737459 RepID=A0ABV7CNG9_9GAMM